MHERCNASEIVERQVAAGRGEARAIVAADATLTYDALRRQINRAGHVLRQLGVGREQRVLLVLDDTTAFPVLFLAAMRIGAVPVPVSVLDKDDNFRHFLDDSYAEVVVADAGVLDRLRAALADRPVRWLVRGRDDGGATELDAALAAQPDELDAVATHRDDMAFWLYSSGSTGKPKGVVHLHHDIAFTCENYAGRVLGLRPDDVCFSTTKLFHAYGLGNGLTFPLHFGATSVLLQGPPKPAAILETLRRHRPSVFFSVPALFGLLVRHPDADGALDSVRFCVSAAEPLPAATIQRWQERFGRDIVDGIGSTEMLHIYCSNRPGNLQPGTTGWPVPGYELRLIDDHGESLEGPGIGALQVRGDSCAAFYWHQHEKTKASMLGDWFATGDRYQRGVDGTYSYVGRADDMLKVGGLWVSPVDMEHTLSEHPRVDGVGVVGVTVDGTSRVAAYVQCSGAPGDDVLADELRAWCKERMRRYEYPHLVSFVEDLPRTLTGKVQRFRLREWAALTLQAAAGAPTGPITSGRRSSSVATTATNSPAAIKAPGRPSADTSGPAISEPATMPASDVGSANP
jgi:benzoate-CoA ligase family protein